MIVKAKAPEARTVTIDGTVEEFALIYAATRPGRRTNAQLDALKMLGNLIRVSDSGIADAGTLLEAEDNERKASDTAKEAAINGAGHEE